MNTIRLDRLEKLLAHMQSGKLSVDKFDFSTFRDHLNCGTVGCMAGELPTVFPDEWAFKGRWNNQVLIDGYLSKFFGIEEHEVNRLFYPLGSFWNVGSVLPSDATREEVAENLRMFIEEKKGEL